MGEILARPKVAFSPQRTTSLTWQSVRPTHHVDSSPPQMSQTLKMSLLIGLCRQINSHGTHQYSNDVVHVSNNVVLVVRVLNEPSLSQPTCARCLALLRVPRPRPRLQLLEAPRKQAPRQSVLKAFDAMFVGRCPASLDVFGLTIDVSTSGGRTQITTTIVIKCVAVVGRILLQLSLTLLTCSS